MCSIALKSEEQRSIHTQCNTSRLSNFLDKILRPCLQVIKSHIWNDIDFVLKMPRKTDEKKASATFDITNMYSNINNDLEQETIRVWLPRNISKEFILVFISYLGFYCQYSLLCYIYSHLTFLYAISIKNLLASLAIVLPKYCQCLLQTHNHNGPPLPVYLPTPCSLYEIDCNIVIGQLQPTSFQYLKFK